MIYEFGAKTQTGFIRNRFGTLEEVKGWASAYGNTDIYSSIFGYENEAVESCSIYAGLYFDIDHTYLEKAYQDLHSLIELFQLPGIEESNYTICFSGNKGFHIYLHPFAFDLLPSTDLPQVFRKIAEELNEYLPNKTIDFKVYERRRLWRLVNSKHGTTGLFKIQLPLPIPTLQAILKLAKEPQELQQPQPRRNIVLSGWIRRARRELYEPVQHPKYAPVFPKDKYINPNVTELLKGVAKGTRNQTCFYIGCYLKAQGFTENEIRIQLFNFGRNCNPPMREKEIETTLQSALKERIL